VVRVPHGLGDARPIDGDVVLTSDVEGDGDQFTIVAREGRPSCSRKLGSSGRATRRESPGGKKSAGPKRLRRDFASDLAAGALRVRVGGD
jgi:hypothetical protein